jgi:hypothetical protein
MAHFAPGESHPRERESATATARNARVGLILFRDGGLAHGVGVGAGCDECAVF